MIKDVVLIGLGGVGAVYASKIPNIKIPVDDARLKKYTENPITVNGKKYNFNYITKIDKADLIIISAKFYGLKDILNNLSVTPNTIIISLMNGISSEDIISARFPQAIVVPSYLICNSIIRNGNYVTHDDINKIVMAPNKELEEFFTSYNINYEIAEDIKSSMWQKFMLNIAANQLSAVTRMTFGEMNSLPYIDSLLRNILKEVIEIANAEGIKNPEVLAENAINTFKNMAPYGKTSMLQDIENGRKTELDAFALTVINLGKKHRIPMPYSNVFQYLIARK